LPIAANQNAPARPRLELNTGAAPRAAKRKQDGEAVAAPEMSSAQAASNGAASTLIALSATPGPAAPVEPPQGNLAARIAISPEGNNEVHQADRRAQIPFRTAVQVEIIRTQEELEPAREKVTSA